MSSRTHCRNQPSLVPPGLIPRVDDGNNGPAARRTLMHRIDRHEHRRIADRRRRHAAYGGLGMAVVVHVGIIEHDLPAAAQRAAMVRLAFDEAIDDTAVEIL